MMTQDYQAYTEQDHHVWNLLFTRQMQQLPTMASQAYVEGIDKAGFVADHIPNFEEETNPRLRALTGWEVVAVAGLIPNREFFTLLSEKKFPASTWLRRLDQLDYLEEPDMFHDTFGHVPVLTNQAFCDFLAQLSTITLKHIEDDYLMEMVRRLYWYTVEFGLIRENGELKIYGGGILSSSGETHFSLFSDKPARFDYNIEHILATPVKIDEYQPQYFVIDSYEQLYESLPEFEQVLERIAAERKNLAESNPVVAV